MQPISRRHLLRTCAAGFPLLALDGLLAQEASGRPHHAPKATSAIFLFMGGGPSQVDLFDPKPELNNHHRIPIRLPAVTRDASANCQPSPFRFRQYGQSGQWMSHILPHLSTVADELCVVRSCHCDSVEHGAAIRQMFTGEIVLPRPSMGSWLLYGLGSENANLPGFVFIDRQGNLAGTEAYDKAFLPASLQGTHLRGDLRTPIANLQANLPSTAQAHRVEAIRRLNELYEAERAGDSRLRARTESYQLAFRMQAEAPEAFDISRETRETQRLYGVDQANTADYGRKCLLARRLVERGVRFVVANVDNKWDNHGSVREHETVAAGVDQPITALIKDLKARGLLETTLLIWGGEFGRTPTSQGQGRDHHPYGFTMWFAGGGFKPGVTYGATDDFGFYAVQNRAHVHDIHATILWAMGLDHTRLTYRHSGRDYRLTDVYGNVLHDILT